jgi:SAM-dependent methyltransferase
MTVESTISGRTLIRVPEKRVASRSSRIVRALLGSFLSPVYCLLAYFRGGPGLGFRKECALLAIRLLFSGKSPLSFADIYRMLCWPMDSTRYFEFEFMWEAVSGLSHLHYLDVSSPYLFPILLALENQGGLVELMNPDLRDLQTTAKVVQAVRLGDRCNLHGTLLSAAPFPNNSFDLITSISVVEHIPQDTQAILEMWNLLRPGGRLLLTLPCAAQASEQFIDKNEYGLLSPDDDGFFFFQRFYDQKMLEERVFAIAGSPRRQVVYGEKSPGSHRRCLERKWRDPHYPNWREPYMMSKEFCYFNDLAALPGEGVIGLEFEKSE